jgi:micrococcal nuclease
MVDRVVDGDGVAVTLNHREEKLRLSNLDTEESSHGSDKPVTPWGTKTKADVIDMLHPGAPVTLEFPGSESLEVCLERYRDNFGRLLVWLYSGDQDFQELLISQGYSPYFTKYGYAGLPRNHARYVAAERAAQIAKAGIWNQAVVNGSEQRNYPLLGVWWTLRAELIDNYRARRKARPDLPNSRLDYARLHQLANQEEEATVFTELRTYTQVGQNKAVVEIGSKAQPFKLLLPNIEAQAGQEILRLLDQRYISRSPDRVRRSYAYVQGPLKLFNDEPELVVTSADQVADSPE